MRGKESKGSCTVKNKWQKTHGVLRSWEAVHVLIRDVTSHRSVRRRMHSTDPPSKKKSCCEFRNTFLQHLLIDSLLNVVFFSAQLFLSSVAQRSGNNTHRLFNPDQLLCQSETTIMASILNKTHKVKLNQQLVPDSKCHLFWPTESATYSWADLSVKLSIFNFWENSSKIPS